MSNLQAIYILCSTSSGGMPRQSKILRSFRVMCILCF